MIKAKLTDFVADDTLSAGIKRGLEWLKANDLHKLADGRYYIDGEAMYANVETYETRTEADFEAHRRYVDIQYMIRGREYIGVAPYGKCETVVKPYNSERDIEFLRCAEGEGYQLLNEGEFLILYPEDAHKPSMMVDKKCTVKKVVVKVLL